jgi:DNA modification methylase
MSAVQNADGVDETPFLFSPEEENVLGLLAAGKTYKDVVAATGWSHGKIWRLATKAGARKHEERIRRRGERRALLEAMLDQSIEGDVLDVLDAIPDGSVHMIVTSPPYNIGRPYGNDVAHDRKRHQAFRGWLTQIISEFARVLAPGGTIFLQSGTTRRDDGARIPMDVMLFQEFIEAGLTFQSRIAWVASHGLTPKRRLAERWETALVFSSGEPTFNANAARTPQLHPDKRAFKGPNRGQLSGHPLGAAPSDVWYIEHLKANMPERTGHPAQFPVALAKRAILLWSLPGQIVMDPFAGSGSTLVAARECGRAYVGCDLFYSEIRKARIQAVNADTFSPFPGVTERSLEIWHAEARRVGVAATPITLDEERAQLSLAIA